MSTLSATNLKNASATGNNIVLESSGRAVFNSSITFNGDTAAANELDDYEEGEFTPFIVGTTTAGTGTYTTQVGRYTKIGRVVHYSAYLVWTAHTGTGLARVDGLPFTSAAIANLLSAVAIRPDDWTLTANNVMTAYQLQNSTQIVLQQYPAGGGSATTLNMDTAAGLMISGHYIVA